MKSRTSLFFAGALLLISALLAMYSVPIREIKAQSNPLVWAQVKNIAPVDFHLRSVFMLSEKVAWIAGEHGGRGEAVRIELQGGEWKKTISSPILRAPLNAIVAVSDTNVWAVGNDGFIAHMDVTGEWKEVEGLPKVNFETIQMFGNGEVGWAAGSLLPGNGEFLDGYLFRYRDGKWKQHSKIVAADFRDLHFTTEGGWGVGIYGAWHVTEEGATREAVPACNINCINQLSGVRAINADKAWAVGRTQHVMTKVPAYEYFTILHRVSGQWQQVPTRNGLANGPGRGASGLAAVSFTQAGFGLAVGSWKPGDLFGQDPVRPMIVSLRQDGRWYYEDIPYVVGDLSAVSQHDDTHALAVGSNGLILSYGYGGSAPAPWPTPTPGPPIPTTIPPPISTVAPQPPSGPAARVAAPGKPGVLYFPVVGHTLQGGFKEYWLKNGGLAQFGYPITEEYEETYVLPEGSALGYVVQYFERARMEWHPENRTPYDILLGQLGRIVTKGREAETPFKRAPASASPGSQYFPETGHNVPPQFLDYWRKTGGLPVYGYPISEAFEEQSKTDGKPYLVQYFERNRLEYHPELPEPFKVSLGLLGVDVLRMRGWLP